MCDLKNRVRKISQTEGQKENQIKKKKQFKRSLGNIKHTNIHITGVLEGE